MAKEHIVVDPIYFDNIKTVIDAMNNFFESNFKVKEFPTTQPMDIGIIVNSLCWFGDLEPALLEDYNKFLQVVEDIKIEAEKCDEKNIYAAWMKDERQGLIDQVRAVVAVKFLQYISSNFDEFNNLINGVYTLKLYLQPSLYRREIGLFKTFPLGEIDFLFEGHPWTLFDQSSFIDEIFDNKYIHLPSSLKKDDELQRFNSYMDINDSYQVVIEQNVQEAAEVNYFSDTKPAHIKYDEKTKKFKISKQFQKTVDDMINALSKCNTSDDLKNEGQKGESGAFGNPDRFTDTVLPFILAKIYNNNKKYVESNMSTEGLSKYINSYKSIGNKNNGAKRFINYDLFSTFKTDKDGTLKFLKDFLTLELVNNESCAIINNTLLTLFNIFDSRIYLDILYNLIPEKVKKEEYPTEDGFVKQIRGRINKNSRQTNVYKDDTSKQNEKAETSEEIVEYVNDCLKEFGDMSITDMQYCEQYSSLLHDEIKCIPDIMYNKGISPIMIDKYVGESYNVFQEGVMFDKFKNSTPIQVLLRLIDKVKAYFRSLINKWRMNGALKKIAKVNDDMKFHRFVKLLEVGNEKIGLIFQADRKKGLVVSQMLNIPLIEEFNNGKPINPSDVKAIFFEPHKVELIPVSELINQYNQLFKSVDNILKDLKAVKTDDDVKKKSFDILTKIYTNIYNYIFETLAAVNQVIDKLAGANVKPDGSKIKQESFTYQEQEMGGIPDYMKNRINISDENGDTPKVNITDVQIPPDMPTNSMDSLIDSIDNKLETGGDSYDTMLGSGYHDAHPDAGKNKSSGIVYNITNNYTNSFNHDSHNQKTITNNNNDLSTGKTTTTTTHIHNSNSHNNTNAPLKRKTSKGNKGSNNNNNGNVPIDSHANSNVNNDENKTFSNGKTIQEVFAFLESNEEPLSIENDAGEPPKEDLLTKAMDMDRNTLSAQQTAKQKVQKAINTGKAFLKPASRTKQWLTKMIDSLIKRDEDKVKAEIIENPSYRTALYKGMRIALKLGLTGVAFTISGYLGVAYAGIQVAKIADKQRLRKEVQEEFTTELEILDDKIRQASLENTPESRKAKYQMMRLRSKMQKMALNTPHQIVKSPYSI